MRARLANTRPYGKTLEEVQADYDTAVHLLASVQIVPEKMGILRRSRRVLNAKELERRVFTRREGRAVEIVNFVFSELIKKDTHLGHPEKLSNAWITDEAVLELLMRFFHLGKPMSCSSDMKHAEFLSEIPTSLVACLAPNDIVWLVTAVARTAWRLQDFPLLGQALALDLRPLKPDPVELHALLLLKLDYLISTGKLDGGEAYALELLKEHGGFTALRFTPGVPSNLESKARWAARVAKKQLNSDAKLLAFRIRVLARLGELYDLRGRDGEAWRVFFEVNETDRLVPSVEHPVLSGDVGRKALKSLIRLAASNYLEDSDIFGCAKVMAEDIHRRNIERLSGFPAERTDILIDEALLERHLRGDDGRGDVKLSYAILSGDRAEMAALAAPRVDRLEYLLERAKGAMLLYEREGDPDLAAKGLRDIDLIDDLLSSSGVRPYLVLRDVYRTRQRFESARQMNELRAEADSRKIEAAKHQVAEHKQRADQYMKNGGYRLDQLVDCIAIDDEEELDSGWHDIRPKLI